MDNIEYLETPIIFHDDYEVQEYIKPERNIRSVDGIKINTLRKDIEGANILTVEAGTNGYKGGDSGHGSRTFIKIEDASSTDIRIKVNETEDGVSLIFGGDSELRTVIESLHFITDTLEKYAEKYSDKQFK